MSASTPAEALPDSSSVENPPSERPTIAPQTPSANNFLPETATLPPTASVSQTTPDYAISIPGYDVLDELGRGGMGVVYKAEQKGLKRTVALKMMLGGNHASQESRVRFRAEAEAVARLHHPNVVQIHEIGEQQSLPYFA